MAVPSTATYSSTALVAAHTTFRDLLDAGSGPAQLRIRDASDVLLATLTLTDPSGTINGSTGQLTLGISGDATASVSGTAYYGELCDSTGVVHLSLPVDIGTATVAGKLILNTRSFIAGGAVRVVSAVIG